MNDQIINLLDSHNPEDRKRAIKLLINDGSDEALTYLSALYKTETDTEIRELAIKAGKLIRKRQKEALEVDNFESDAFDDLTAPDVDVPEVQVSEMQRTRANSLIELAMNRSVAGDDDAAEKHLFKAFQINPNLLKDDYTVGVAADIMGVTANEARRLLRNGDDAGSGGKEKRKRKNSDSAGEGDATWNDAFTDLLIYMLVVGAVGFVSTLLYFQVFSSTFATIDAELARSGAYAETGGQSFQAFVNMFNTLGITFSIIAAFSSAIGSVIYLLIWFAFIHFVSTMFLSGDGTFRGLIHNSTNIYTIFTVVYTVMGLGVSFLMTNSLFGIFTDPSFTDMSSREMDIYMADSINSISSLIGIFGLVMFLGFVVFLFMTSARIAKTYNFGTSTGCISQVLAYIVLMVVVFGCFCAFGTAISSIFAEVMNSPTIYSSF